jgi:tetratricopeptide (TPR) repeat protein
MPVEFLTSELSNLGIQLAEAGQPSEALAAEQEAVEIRRRLAEGHPAAYEPDLAASLAVFAILLAAEGDLSVALRATKEAVELYHRYVATAPSELPRLHAVLQLQANLFEGLGREEAAKAVRRWLRENPLPPR